MALKFFPHIAEIKIFDKRTRFYGVVIFNKKFHSINIRRPWAPAITMLCSEVIMTSTFKLIKSRKPHISFSTRPFYHLDINTFLTLWVLWLRFTSFLENCTSHIKISFKLALQGLLCTEEFPQYEVMNLTLSNYLLKQSLNICKIFNIVTHKII